MIALHLLLLHFFQALVGLVVVDLKKLGGLDFYRCFEYGSSAEIARMQTCKSEQSIVLDIGSSDTILPHYLSLLGHDSLPAWVNANMSADELHQTMREHIQTLVGYKRCQTYHYEHV